MDDIVGTTAPDIMYVRALYNYEADYDTSLSFHEGDIIRVITQLEGGWWDGVFNGVRGWFPSAYCQTITGPEDLANHSQTGQLDQGDGDEENGDAYEQGIEHEDDECDGDAQDSLPIQSLQGDRPHTVQRTGLSFSPPSTTIPHESPRKDKSYQDEDSNVGDLPALQDLPEIVRDFRLETDSVFETTVHVIHGIHGQRRQTWKWENEIGRGGAAFVRLQSRNGDRGEGQALRAVKCLQLRDSSMFVHYSRELETVIKFSHSKVRFSISIFLMLVKSNKYSTPNSLSAALAGFLWRTGYISL